MSARFLIWERLDVLGKMSPVYLDAAYGGLTVCDGDLSLGTLPLEALFRIMDRFGKELEEGIALPSSGLDLGGGVSLHRLRFLARYDVIARDWLVLCRPSRAPVGELAVSVTGALEHLARALGRGSAAREA